MGIKKTTVATVLLAGLTFATTFSLAFAVFSVWLMPTDITIGNIQQAPNTQFFVCENATVQTMFCKAFSINASSASNNATLNVSWVQNTANCDVRFIDSNANELADFSGNTTYTLPATYPAGSEFGIKVFRRKAKAGDCQFNITPVVE